MLDHGDFIKTGGSCRYHKTVTTKTKSEEKNMKYIMALSHFIHAVHGN